MDSIVSIDPGKDKCGILIANLEKNIVLEASVVKSENVIFILNLWKEKYKFNLIILGNGTTGKYWLDLLKDIAPIQFIEEYGTTLRARARFWELWPPKGIFRFFPRSLLFPPNYLDSVVALILLEDYLKVEISWTVAPPSFRIET